MDDQNANQGRTTQGTGDNTSQGNKKVVIVDQEACIGCALCTSIAEDTFVMNDEGKSEAVNPHPDSEDDVQTAIDSCPVTCINWKN